MKLFATGFLQVLLVTIQTYLIAHSHYAGVAVFGFLISFVWTHNVKKIAIGGLKDSTIYSLGASSGALLGLSLANLIK